MSVDYSIVIPAYNEADWLPDMIAAVKKAMTMTPLNGEIIVCDNNSADNTASCAKALGAKVVFEVYNQISRARNTGARAAEGKYLVFIDADTLISGELLNEALERLQSNKYCGGGSIVELDVPVNALSQWSLNVWTWVSVKRGIAAGCFVFCKREDFDAIGGFSEGVYASEEIWLSRALRQLAKRRGQQFSILTDYPVISSARKMQWFSMSKQALLVLMLIMFPFLVRFRKFCWFWYKRPVE